ncbi:reverse transcriptase (RNA-dependent DNA polymerase) domain-containing protein [Phthorimaea operculella]|nr:reverse transcriptase (RNA-dependent DNA polymerase) domain-containing protein [Phthorimaea operculella]
MDEQLNQLITSKVVKEQPASKGFVSPMFLRKKQDGSHRLIFNLKRLNDFVATPKFHLINLHNIHHILQSRDYMIKIDISQAYYHIPITTGHQRFLSFLYKNKFFHMTCLPFGLASAPSIFAKVTNWIAQYLREQNIKTIVYLDDFLIMHQDKEILKQQSRFVLQLLEDLGWCINYKKSIIAPSRIMEYLGVVWDTENNKKYLPSMKVTQYVKYTRNFQSRGFWSWMDAKVLLGKLNFTAEVIPLGRLHCRIIQRCANQLPQNDRYRKFPIPAQVQQELSWWIRKFQMSSPVHYPKVSKFITTDAADDGWGAILNSERSPLSPPQPTKPSSGSQNEQTTPRSGRHDPGGLEGTGWSDALVGWTNEQFQVIESSWRASTLKTYRPAWKRWLEWAAANNVDSKEPTAKELAHFLCYLFTEKNFSLSTIMLHKSVVCTFCNPELSESLSKHALVRHALKGIGAKRPTIKARPPIWNVSDLINWLKQTTVNEQSIFEVSRQVAILLLLNTGRRIHDLTLLDIRENFFEDDNDVIRLWPKHGSKTDTSTYSQSGWEISKNPNKNLDLVHWTRRLREVTADRRGSLSSLFITTRGKAKPASRTVIAGWIRTLFKEANISASPGSCRAAVATDNWINQGMDLEEVLKRGNWRQGDTFIKYYLMEINPRPTAQCSVPSVSCDFTPI